MARWQSAWKPSRRCCQIQSAEEGKRAGAGAVVLRLMQELADEAPSVPSTGARGTWAGRYGTLPLDGPRGNQRQGSGPRRKQNAGGGRASSACLRWLSGGAAGAQPGRHGEQRQGCSRSLTHGRDAAAPPDRCLRLLAVLGGPLGTAPAQGVRGRAVRARKASACLWPGCWAQQLATVRVEAQSRRTRGAEWPACTLETVMVPVATHGTSSSASQALLQAGRARPRWHGAAARQTPLARQTIKCTHVLHTVRKVISMQMLWVSSKFASLLCRRCRRLARCKLPPLAAACCRCLLTFAAACCVALAGTVAAC